MSPDVERLTPYLGPAFEFREQSALDAARRVGPASRDRAPRRVGPTIARARITASLARTLCSAAAVAGLAVFVLTPLDLHTQAALAVCTFLLALASTRTRGHVATLSLVLLSVASSGRYLWWRLTTTIDGDVSVDTALGALLLAAELYASLMLVLAYVQSVAALRRRPAALPRSPALWPSVDVLIPTFDEPLEVVRATVLAARSIAWPRDRLRVYVLDDGHRESFRRFAAEAGADYLARPDHAHAKAGNLNHALSATNGELVAVFDCDHVPVRTFLQVTAGAFLEDARLAAVQTPHHFYSQDPFDRNLGTAGRVPPENDLFYGVIQCGIDTWNASLFCGSCALLRRSALEDVGGFATDTVTEDAHTALRLHRKGWRTAYLDVPQAAGLATETLSAHVGQRVRWARGMAQIFRIDNPLLGRGLTVPQRLSYLAAMLHFFSGIPRLVFLVAPVAYLVFGRHVFNALPAAAVWYGLPHLAHAIVANSRLHGRFRHSFWSEVYETCLAPYIALPTAFALVAPQRGRFNVTVKGGRIERPFFDLRIASPYLVFAAVNLLALGAGASTFGRGGGEVDALAINLAWALHNLVIVAATIAAACERRQVRSAPRVAARIPVVLRLGAGRTVTGATVDLGRTGCRVAVPPTPRLVPGERILIVLLPFEGERTTVAADVVDHSGREARVRFSPSTLAEEARIVRALFSRADAWIGWADRYPRDRPLLALCGIAWRGAAGTVRSLAVAARTVADAAREGAPQVSRGRP